MGLPSGTVTFLFTDIERSTETVAELGNERYADVLDDQRERLRQAFDAHDGHEVSTEGDAFFIAFVRAQDAVLAAIDGQKSLADHTLRVRMGVHTGEALVRGGDYVGHDVHKAKRICDAGHGGQILVSETTADLVRATAQVADLGPHRLKDLEEAQRLFQVRCDGLPHDFPPLRSLESFRHNLPLQRSAFIGREDDIAQVRKQIERERLVTLTGVGGCGKTRLALQAGAELLDQFPDGVFFVDLSTMSDPKALAATAAQAVGVRAPTAFGFSGPGTADELLMDFLRTNTCLVIFDNCEHLLDEAAELVDRILSTCAGVTVLATSREPLDVEGEQAWRVPSLTVSEDASDVDSSEAVSLFKARAKAVQPEFELTPSNVGAVAEICARLDGIPLAIEFAAARIGHLSPRQIADRLSDRFHLLTGSRRRVQRQQTLQAALDWSYDLLRDDERTLLRRLAVFAGPFRLSAVEGVCADDELPRAAVTNLLGSLVSKSLVVTEAAGDELRFRLLETVRLYAEDHLVRAGESATIRRRHRDHYLAWLESHPWEDLYVVSTLSEVFEIELPHVRAAIEWSAAEGEYSAVGEMAARMFPSLYWNLHPAEGSAWLSMAFEHEDPPSDILVNWVTAAAGYALIGSSDIGRALELAARAIELSPPVPNAAYVMAASWSVIFDAVIAQFSGNRAATEGIRDRLEALGEAGGSISRRWQGIARVFAGVGELCLGDPDRAIIAFESGLKDVDADCAQVWLAGQSHLTAAAIAAGDVDKAVVASLQGLEHPESGRWMILVELVAGAALGCIGEHERARPMLLTAIDRSAAVSVPGWLEETMTGVAVYLAGVDPRAASALLSWVKSQTFDVGNPSRTAVGYTFYRHAVKEVRRVLDADAVDAGKARGRAMSRTQVIALARDAVGS